MARVFVLLAVIFVSVYLTEQAYFLEKDFIDEINEQATSWKAGVNFDPSTSEAYIKQLLGSKGVQIPNKNNMHMYKSSDAAYDDENNKIPRHFDARRNWKNCKSIGHIPDQGNCGSCWAVATSSAFADRLCIATNGDFNALLSAEETTFCCHSCGNGCHGGIPIKAWERFVKKGIVTGGDYGSKEGCEPYRVPPCPYDDDGNNTCAGKPRESNHRCRRKCYGDKNLEFDDDHRYTRDSYYLTYESIQKDIMTYGPIEASFDVYSDFPSYKSGVYVRTENATYLGGHAAKVIGWGEEYGRLYWLVVNSWNEDWGDNGIFKIQRGTNECGFDNSTTGGVPVADKALYLN